MPDGQLIVDVAKGMEEKTLMTMSEVIEDELAKAPGHEHCRVVALSGPTHAEEVARDLPTVIVAAAKDVADAKTVQKIFTNPNFRVYTNTDRRGTELGGAIKNVIALSVGIAMGLGLRRQRQGCPDHPRQRRAQPPGHRHGLPARDLCRAFRHGDLIVTCTSMHSRNLHAGMLIGRGAAAEEAKKEVGQVVEGINALPAARRLEKKYKVEMPIVDVVDAILSGKMAARDAVDALMGRNLKGE